MVRHLVLASMKRLLNEYEYVLKKKNFFFIFNLEKLLPLISAGVLSVLCLKLGNKFLPEG